MRMKHKIVTALLLVASCMIVFLGFSFSDAAINLTATLYGIFSGFLVTTITILFGSALSKHLYSQRNNKSACESNLHILERYLRYAFLTLFLGLFCSVAKLTFPVALLYYNFVLDMFNVILVYVFLLNMFFIVVFLRFLLKAMIFVAR